MEPNRCPWRLDDGQIEVVDDAVTVFSPVDGASRAAEGPMPDWPTILSRDGPAAWRTAYRLLGHRADADECFQDACLAALEVSRRQPVRHWRALLQRLAAARAVDRLRERFRRPA